MSKPSAATQDEIRRHNLARIVGLLHRRGAMSRSALVGSVGLNRSTVGILAAELVDVGLVRESAGVGQGVGRPSRVVEPVPESAVVIAYDLKVERGIAALVGFGGQVFERREIEHRRQGWHSRAAVKQLAGIADELLESRPRGSTWVGTAVSVPGVVRRRDGMVRFAPNLGWVDVPLGDALSLALGSSPSIVVGNDADLGALAEQVRGAAAGAQNAIYLSGDVGVGGGIILGGQLMTGAGGYGGEVGHMVVNQGGANCRCGSSGCWETEVGLDSIARAVDPHGKAASLPDAIDRLDGADSTVQSELRKLGVWLGIGISNLVNVFNPEVVVLGGIFRQLYPHVEQAVNEQIATALKAPAEQVTVKVAALGADSPLVGAAETAFSRLLQDPLGTLNRSARVAGVS